MNIQTRTKNKTVTSTKKPPVSTIIKLKGALLLIVILMFIGFSVSKVSASELTTASISYGAKKNQLSEQVRNLVIAQNNSSAVYDQLIGKASTKTRKELIEEKQSNANNIIKNKSGVVKSNAPASARYYAPEFSIYNAFSFLEDDFDGDGYYQTFGVIFDADVYNPNGNEESVIYAELYLSTDGIHWEHYYTTEDFLISGNNAEDEFEVITTLASGYPTNTYDVLIDIYEVGYSDIVATYSSNDTNALYALPLESANYDEIYVEEIIIHGGSSSIAFILLALITVFIKRNRINPVK